MSRKGEFRVNTSDIEGEKFGKLKVECLNNDTYESTEGGERHRYYYKCTCECGNQKVIRRESLKLGLSKSCGCSRKSKCKVTKRIL